MDRGRAFAPHPQDSMGRSIGRHEWRGQMGELRRDGVGPPRTVGNCDTGEDFESRRGGHFEGRREGGRGGGGQFDGRREGDHFGHRRDGGHFTGWSEGGHGGRREVDHSDDRREGVHYDSRREGGHSYGRREVGYSNSRREGSHYDSMREGGHSDGRREGGCFNGRRGGGHFYGRREDGYYDGKLDNGERHFGLSSERGKGEAGYVKSGVWGKSRKPQIPEDGWGATLRLSNIPDGVTIGRLRRILQEKGVSAGFDIKTIWEGSGLVSFVEDSERVVEMLGKLKIDDCLLQIGAVHHESETNSGEIKTKKPTVEKKGNKKKSSAVSDKKNLSTDSKKDIISTDLKKEIIIPVSNKKKLSPVSEKKRRPDSNKKKISPVSEKEKISHDSSKVPQYKKDAEAVFKQAIGLFVPDSYEVRDGKLMLVYSMEMDILEDFEGKLDRVLESGSVDVLIDPIEILSDQGESSEDKNSKVTDGNSQENWKTVPTDGGEIVDQTVIDDQWKGKEENVGEEAIKEWVEAEPLQQVEVVFASMDVREKQKVIEQAKQKSLGDFIITTKPKQGQIKKKKKRKTANAEKNLEDDAQKARTNGH